MNGPLTAMAAWYYRGRGRKLPVNKEYTDPRLLEIAIEQATLLDKIEALDKEIKALNAKENKARWDEIRQKHKVP